MKLISCNLDNYICVDTSVKKCTDVLIKGAAIPGKSAMMLNFTIHYNFNIENHGIVHVETIIFFQAIFINKPIATPSVNFTLTLYWRIAIIKLLWEVCRYKLLNTFKYFYADGMKQVDIIIGILITKGELVWGCYARWWSIGQVHGNILFVLKGWRKWHEML